MSEIVRIRYECSDPRPDHHSIDPDPGDIFVPNVGAVMLGEPEYLINKVYSLAEHLKVDAKSLAVMLMPHNPCAAVNDSMKAIRLGLQYSTHLSTSGIRSASLFLGDKVRLHNKGAFTNDEMKRVFDEAGAARRRDYDKRDVKITEVAVAPFFTREDRTSSSANVLYIASEFFSLKGIEVLRGVLGGAFPHRNYRSVSKQEKDLFEAAFAAA